MSDASFSSYFLSSRSDRPRLRIGVLVDGTQVASAYASVLEDIAASDFADLSLVVIKAGGRPSAHSRQPSPTRWSKLLGVLLDGERRRVLGWSLYVPLDRRRVRLANDPLAPQDCRTILDGVESIEVEPIATNSGWRFPDDAVALVRSRQLDVILRFGFAGLGGEILDAAAHGTWEFHHGDRDRYRGGPAYFWEMVEANPVSGVALERMSDGPDPAMVLDKAFFPTDMGSYARNRVQPYFGSSHMVIQKLKEAHESGWESLAQRAVQPGDYVGRRPHYRQPTNLELVRWIGPRLPRKVRDWLARSLLGRSTIGHWRIAIRTRRHLGLEGSADMSGFRWVEAPRGHMYADPFIAERDGKTWLFVEDLSYAEKRAVISCAEITDDGSFGASRVVLSSDGHISYPYVFFDGSSAYMIPETYAEGSVRLYRAVDFPYGWEFSAELFSIGAVDTSVLEFEGRWWFFTTLREPRGKGMMLVLFYADRLDGPWVFHPMNPISVDVRNVRGAGSIYRQDGRLIRPSQDCSLTYGYKFTMREIVRLSPTEYAERPLVTIGPDWDHDLLATHTYNRGTMVEVTDGAVRRSLRQLT